MRQSITTKYLGPSNVRGSRIKAVARKRGPLGGEMAATVPYGYGNTEEEHCAAARTLAQKLGWSGFWIGGGNVDEDGYVFVNFDPPLAVNGERMGQENSDWFFPGLRLLTLPAP